MDLIIQLIGSLGFPIAACCALFWNQVQSNSNYQETISKLTETINENTNSILCLQALIEKVVSNYDKGD